MELNKILDYAIVNDETTKEPKLKAGYIVNSRNYDNYVENSCFNNFVENMKTKYPTAYKMYGAGGGKELEERKVDKNVYPPKMASFGSSSRMIFNLMKDTQGFLFEKQLPTTVGGTANLDGFMETDSKYIFIEAKCREPYSTKNNIYDRKYEKLYNFINDSKKSNVTCDIKPIDEKKMKVTFNVNDKKIHNFDMKQMICHLLGVATAFLKGELEIKNIDFIYLLFNPTLIEIADEKSKAKIHKIYNNTCDECNAADFKALFEIIVDYLKLYKEWNTDIQANKLANNFTFRLSSQDNIKL